jgi:hypothetical protein
MCIAFPWLIRKSDDSGGAEFKPRGRLAAKTGMGVASCLTATVRTGLRQLAVYQYFTKWPAARRWQAI